MVWVLFDYYGTTLIGLFRTEQGAKDHATKLGLMPDNYTLYLQEIGP